MWKRKNGGSFGEKDKLVVTRVLRQAGRKCKNSTVVFQLNISNNNGFCASISRPNTKPQTVRCNFMKTKPIYIIGIILLFSCSTKERNSNNSLSEIKSVNENNEPYNGNVLVYDWDRNGVLDTFQLDEYKENVLCKINGTISKIESGSTQFGSLSEPGFQSNNKVKDSLFCFVNLNADKEVLMLKDLGDFSGPILFIYELDGNKPKKSWEGFGDIIRLADIDNDNLYDIVLKDIVNDPGSYSEYDFIEYPLYRVYNYQNNEVQLDTSLSAKYNLKNNPRFEETIGMKKPLRARKRPSNSDTFDLIIDAEKIK